MMFTWLRKRRRKKILEEPFLDRWREILTEQVVHYSFLSPEEKVQLEQLVQVFAAEKNFEGCGGLEITDEIRIVISAEACMLVLGLPHDLYRGVDSILVYPSTVISKGSGQGVFTRGPFVSEEVPILGQAHIHGPVILVWDAVKRGAVHPESGHNVVYHEFAHKLDMLDGAADGVPPLHDADQYKEWAAVCNRVFNDLRRNTDKGRRTFLDPYGATNEAEFFAVSTEYFFDKPIQMKKRRPQLYEILSRFYNQDTAKRQGM